MHKNSKIDFGLSRNVNYLLKQKCLKMQKSILNLKEKNKSRKSNIQ